MDQQQQQRSAAPPWALSPRGMLLLRQIPRRPHQRRHVAGHSVPGALAGVPQEVPPPRVLPAGGLPAGWPGKVQAPLDLPLHRLVGAVGAKAGERITSNLATFLLTSKATHASEWNPTQFSPSNNFY